MNIIPELNLGCHPKDVKNNSLADATNVMVCNNSTILESECRLGNITDSIIPNEVKNKNIIYAIPCNKEILFFNLEENKTITIIRYDEERNETKKVLEGLSYNNGELLGTFTYNGNNDLIIALSEYNANIEVPLKTINFGKWEDNIVQDLNKLDICPKVRIPSVKHKYTKGSAYKGWYYVFIRYKINDYDYTQWFNTNYYFLIDSFTKQTVLNTYLSREVYEEIYGKLDNNIAEAMGFPQREVIDYNLSDNKDIADITASIEVIDLDNTYTKYQLSFICINKLYTKSFITKDLDIYSKNIEITNLENYNVEDIIKTQYNYYNVKSLDFINNRIYISNYNTKNNNLSDFNFKLTGKLKYNKLNIISDEIIQEYYLAQRTINEETYTFYKYEWIVQGSTNLIKAKDFIYSKFDRNGNYLFDTEIILPNREYIPVYSTIGNDNYTVIANIEIDKLYFDITNNKYIYDGEDFGINNLENYYILIERDVPLQICNRKYTWSEEQETKLIENTTLNVLNSAGISPEEYYNFFISFVDEYGEISNPIKIRQQNINFNLKNGLLKTPSEEFYNKKLMYETIEITSLDKLPNGYIGYFISYEKFESVTKHRGFLVKDYQDTEENVYYFYSDSLNYNDSISLNFNTLVVYDNEGTEVINNNINIIDKYDEDFPSFIKWNFKIKEAKLLVADSIGNELNSTRIKLKIIPNESYDGEFSIADYHYCELINDNIEHLYQNNVKTLIPCSNICYDIAKPLIINTKNSFISNITAYVINNIYFDSSVNVFKIQDGEYQNNSTYSSKKFIDVPNESISINNAPTVVAFLKNITTSNFKSLFHFGSVIEAKNTIDLFKMRQYASYEQYPKSLFYDENQRSEINFPKTIRRSNVIQDESNKNAWRIFNTLEYKNINENKGDITKLIGIGKYIIVHTEHSIFLFNATDTIKSNEGGIQLASVDILNLNYQEIITSRLGYAGLQKEHHGIIGTFGYIFYSVEDKAIYRYNADKLITIDDIISNYIRKHNFSDAIFVDDKYRNRLLIKFTNDEMSVILSYNYKTNSFVSLHDYDFVAGYSTKNNIYVLSSNDTIKQFNENYFSKSSISVVVNTNYELMKYLDVIKYKINKPKSVSSRHNILVPPGDLNNTAEGIITNLRIYSEYCDTEDIPVINNTLIPNLNIKDDYNTPYWRFGNWHFSAIRNKLMNETIPSDQKSRIFGNWFVVKFDVEKTSCAIYESLDYKISFDEN